MNSVFLDTSGLVGVVNTDDQWHSQAEIIWEDLIASPNELITTSLVLIELADGLARVRHRRLALQIIDGIQASDRITIVPSDEPLEAIAWRLFRERMDKEWGMTDCVSITLMSQRGITKSFTADNHFEQAGFQILLK